MPPSPCNGNCEQKQAMSQAESASRLEFAWGSQSLGLQRTGISLADTQQLGTKLAGLPEGLGNQRLDRFQATRDLVHKRQRHDLSADNQTGRRGGWCAYPSPMTCHASAAV